MSRMSWVLDHLVVAARHLDDGVAWCEATFGFRPDAGGEHPLMGTHNRVFAIGSERFPRAYFEIIAIDPRAASPGRSRWYDLDHPALQRTIADGPALVHWVAGCSGIEAEVAALRAQGIERGEVLSVERATPRGTLRWRISVRADGARLADGACPTLIEWDSAHPGDTLAPSGIRLESLVLSGPPSGVHDRLPTGTVASGQADAAPLVATFSTPRGPVSLRAPRIPS